MSLSTSQNSNLQEKTRPGLMARTFGLRRSLSGKLILLTILVVMAAEIFIYVPSIARYRMMWLEERLASAQIAVLALEEAPEGMVSDELTDELLRNAEVFSVALRSESSRTLYLAKDMPPDPERYVDVREFTPTRSIIDAFGSLFYGDGRNLGVRGDARFRPGSTVEIVIDETPLCADMIAYSWNILRLSLVIALMTALVVYVALMRLTVRPIEKITKSMERFRQHPEDGRYIIEASDRGDEVGRTERELYQMQRELQVALQQRGRLAELGGAVSRINHDLRNILTSAQLISDQLVRIDDPKVQRLGPKLFSAIDRAVDLCTDTLKYGKAEEAPPHIIRLNLKTLIEDVQALMGLDDASAPRLVIEVPSEAMVEADQDQLFRILLNLVRNGVDALTSGGLVLPDGEIIVRLTQADGTNNIDVIDNGPGIPEAIRTDLFKPFSGSSTPGGTGLGLAIAFELTHAHGGILSLLHTGDVGTCFRVCLPPFKVAEQVHVEP
jgi:signal transduction histidine kinase